MNEQPHPILIGIEGARMVAGISKAELSRRCGLDKAFWSASILGNTKHSTLYTISKIAAFFNLEIIAIPKGYVELLEHEVEVLGKEVNVLREHVSAGFIRSKGTRP